MSLREFRQGRSALLGACLGMAIGSPLDHYTLNLFAPALLQEFGWSKADFALVGSVPLLAMFALPLIGRFADRFGIRTSLVVGFSSLTLAYLAFASMNGSLAVFFTIVTLKSVFGSLSAALIFSSVIVHRFDTMRGIALSIAMTAAPLSGAIAAPLLGHEIDTLGWRTAYLTMAALSAGGGLIVISLIGRQDGAVRRRTSPRRLEPGELARLLRSPILLLILGGMFLVNIPQILASSQLKLIATDTGANDAEATWMISLYAIGVIGGRILSGLALDRMQPHRVAFAMLSLPAIGYLAFAAPSASVGLLAAAVGLIGFAQGAEGDIGAYLISRRFGLENFGMLLSFLTAMLGVGSAAGSLILSATLRSTGGYDHFILIAAATSLAGAICFGLTGSRLLSVDGTCQADARADDGDEGGSASIRL